MNKPVTRHEFFRSLGRKGLLLSLAGLGSAALMGSKSPRDCIDTGYCDSCKSFTACALPEKTEAPDE